MKLESLEKISHFLTRTSMWIYPINETSIVSFIQGFEAGIGKNIFTTELTRYLESEYEIYGSNQGWPRQILLYAEKRNITWSEAFLEIGRLIIDRLKTADQTQFLKD